MNRKGQPPENASDTLKSTLKNLESALKDWESVVETEVASKTSKRAIDAATRTKELLLNLKNQLDELS